MINWNAIQAPKDPKTKEAIPQTNCKPRYMAMGSFHADAHKGGKSRKQYRQSGQAGAGK